MVDLFLQGAAAHLCVDYSNQTRILVCTVPSLHSVLSVLCILLKQRVQSKIQIAAGGAWVKLYRCCGLGKETGPRAPNPPGGRWSPAAAARCATHARAPGENCESFELLRINRERLNTASFVCATVQSRAQAATLAAQHRPEEKPNCTHLHVGSGVPVCIIQNHPVSARQVDAQAADLCKLVQFAVDMFVCLYVCVCVSEGVPVCIIECHRVSARQVDTQAADL